MNPLTYPTGIDRRRRRVLTGIAAGLSLPAFGGVSTAKQVRTVVDFDAPTGPGDPGDLPENLTIDGDGNVFMSMALTREIRKLPAGKTRETGLDKDDTELVATLGAPGSVVTGVAVAEDGTLYAANTNFDPGTASAIWSVAPDGTPTQLASLPTDAFPNGVLIDGGRDRLLVSDSLLGRIWAVDIGGGASDWLTDLSLAPGTVLGFGANGVAVSEEVLHVANLDFGRIVRIPIQGDGSPGSVSVLVEDPSLVGADGIAFHNESTLHVSVNLQNAIRRVNGGGKIKTVVSGDPLDFPADVAFDTRGRGRLYVANFALESGTGGNPALLATHP